MFLLAASLSLSLFITLTLKVCGVFFHSWRYHCVAIFVVVAVGAGFDGIIVTMIVAFPLSLAFARTLSAFHSRMYLVRIIVCIVRQNNWFVLSNGEREREENVTASVAKRSVRVRAYALANYYMYVSLVYLFIHLLLLCGRHTHANGEKLEFFHKMSTWWRSTVRRRNDQCHRHGCIRQLILTRNSMHNGHAIVLFSCNKFENVSSFSVNGYFGRFKNRLISEQLKALMLIIIILFI